jgi:thioredoxin-related protein
MSAGAEVVPGRLKGGVNYALPTWFKPSFLNFQEEAQDAGRQGKHLMVFVHLEQCPYCDRMLKENFVSGDTRDFADKHFDAIGVNMRGTVEAVWIDGTTYTERSLSRHLKVTATPTIVFLDPGGKKVLQLTGYRDPRSLRLALDYVQSKRYLNQPFSSYLAERKQASLDLPALYVLRDHPQFATTTNFKHYQKPLAILFEDRRCAECARFHDKTLNHPDVLAEMKEFHFVRLDAGSTEPVTDLDGNITTPAQWVNTLGLTYRPAVVLFNRGKEVFRVDARLYHFHFKEMLRYVSGGHDTGPDAFSRYNAARRSELLQQGISIDYAE